MSLSPVKVRRLVQELGKLEEQTVEPIQRMAEIKKELLDYVNDQEGGKVVLESRNYQVEYSAKTTKTTCTDKERVYNLANQSLDMFKPSSSRAKAVLSEEDYNTCFKEEEGNRRLIKIAAKS